MSKQDKSKSSTLDDLVEGLTEILWKEATAENIEEVKTVVKDIIDEDKAEKHLRSALQSTHIAFVVDKRNGERPETRNNRRLSKGKNQNSSE